MTINGVGAVATAHRDPDLRHREVRPRGLARSSSSSRSSSRRWWRIHRRYERRRIEKSGARRAGRQSAAPVATGHRPGRRRLARCRSCPDFRSDDVRRRHRRPRDRRRRARQGAPRPLRRQLPGIPLVLVESPYRELVSHSSATSRTPAGRRRDDGRDRPAARVPAAQPDRAAPVQRQRADGSARHSRPPERPRGGGAVSTRRGGSGIPDPRTFVERSLSGMQAARTGQPGGAAGTVWTCHKPSAGRVAPAAAMPTTGRADDGVNVGAAMIGGRRPLTGRKAGDRAHPRRATARALFPIRRPRPARRARGSVPAADPRWARPRARSRRGLRPATRQRSRYRGAPLEVEGACDLQLGRDLVLRVRDRGDPAGPGPRRRSRDAAVDRGLDRDRAPAAVVAVSYRQVCRAYPNGGGAYVVARTNLAPIFGLIAAASLLIDYVMTVAVSTASAIAQIQSVIPAAYDVRIEIAFVSIGADHGRQPARTARVREYLRGPDLPVRRARAGDRRDRRSRRSSTGTAEPVPPRPDSVPLGTEALGILLLLRAFAGGSVALTGVEAIANGVPAFKPPESKNAANTMTVDGGPARASCSSG